MSPATFSEHIIRILVVTLKDRIDAFSAPQIREQLHAKLEAGQSLFVVDLSETPFLDSAGMAVLVSLLKGSRQAGGDVKLVWPQHEGASRILHLTKFDRVFEMADTVDEALQMF